MVIDELCLQRSGKELCGVRVVAAVRIGDPLPLGGGELVGLFALVVKGVVNLRSVGSHFVITSAEQMREMESDTLQTLVETR